MTETTEPTARVVVGVDGSPGAAEALREAAHEAVIRRAELDVVHVWASPVVGSTLGGFAIPYQSDVYRDAHRKLLDDSVQEAMERVDTSPDHVERHLVQDYSVASALVAAAKGADLLVVGSRGRGGFAGLLLGSVSQQCLHHSPCPVLVVPDENSVPEGGNP